MKKHAYEIDKPRCNCAVVGIYGNRNAALLAYQALYAMQHRGDESTGIVTSDRSRPRSVNHIQILGGSIDQSWVRTEIAADSLIGVDSGRSGSGLSLAIGVDSDK